MHKAILLKFRIWGVLKVEGVCIAKKQQHSIWKGNMELCMLKNLFSFFSSCKYSIPTLHGMLAFLDAQYTTMRVDRTTGTIIHVYTHLNSNYLYLYCNLSISPLLAVTIKCQCLLPWCQANTLHIK